MQIIDAINQAQWDAFITSHSDANFLQSWAWGDFHASRGKTVIRRILTDNKGNIKAAYTGQVEDAKRGKHIEIAGGPILDWSNKKIYQAIFDDIKAQGQKYHCVFVRVRPQIQENLTNRNIFMQAGFRSAPYYLSVELAGILDLDQDEETIKKNCSTRIRRALNKAKKAGVTVEVSTDPERIHEFYQIQLETASRHHFFSFSESFLKKQFAAFAKYGQVQLYIAKLNNQVLAENFMIFYGNEASYHYGVSSEAGTKISSAPLLHFAAMEEARRRGIKRYNFWGITEEDATKHRFYGVSRFKRGFGVSELRYLHAHDLVLKPCAYKINWLIERARSLRRHV